MDPDPFESLLPPRSQTTLSSGGEPDLVAFSEEAPVLSLPAKGQEPSEQNLPERNGPSAAENGQPLKPMGESRSRRDARETEEIVKAVVGQFANGIAKVLEATNRCELWTTNLAQPFHTIAEAFRASCMLLTQVNAD